MLTLRRVIEDHRAYLHLQHRMAKAIHNRDERLLLQLKEISQEACSHLEESRNECIQAIGEKGLPHPEPQSDLEQLVILIKDAQWQLEANAVNLQDWLGQMEGDLRQYRASQSAKGLLATYVQQREAGPYPPPHFTSVNPSEGMGGGQSANADSPFSVLPVENDTVGHHINHPS